MRRLALAALAPLLAAARPQETARPLREQLEAAVQSLKLKDARVGVLVHSTRGGRPVYALNEREPFLLASNTKLLTTAAALCLLGPDFKFRTSAGMSGEDLRVVAGGDPNLSGRFHEDDPTAIFKAWAAKLKASGVSRVRNIVLHTGIFDAEHLNPGWKGYDLWWWWSAPFGALSLNDNCVDLRLEPGAEGEPCRVTLSPATPYVTLVNQTRSAAKPRRPFGFTRAPGTNTITLRGDVAGRSSYSVAIHDPSRFFGTVLKETLAASGIEVAGTVEETDAPPDGAYRELASWESGLVPTLATCNQPSQNFYAEMLLRTLGWKIKGKGTLENGLAAVREFLEREPKLEETSQKDGSGLTRENRSSPSDLVKLLRYMRAHPHAPAFVDSLPANGAAKGTLRNRMTAADVKGRVRAKTGHIGGVATLSGYAESAGGDTFVFSILVNAPEGVSTVAADRLQDRMCEILARHKGE
jgi:D-alanyl-D-alanine carboxypeptidase/D-alanyl-D-alanine-endopeptidase (penicillin-binding protein 4)